MPNRLKILHLEDVKADAELVEKELKRGKFSFEKLVVSNKADFQKALAEFSADVILSDHCLPSFDSLEALKMLKQSGSEVPFILVTGTVSEEFAVEIMKAGAYDYIVKDRMARLPQAVTNAVEKCKADIKYQSTYEKLLFHLENTPLGFIEWDKDLRIKFLSKRAEEIFGWSLHEFIENERTGYSQVYEEDQSWVYDMAAQLISGPLHRNNTQHRNYTKEGKVIWCDWFNSVLRDKHGKAMTIFSLIQDITERKTAEEKLKQSESRLKEAQAIAHLGNWEIDMVSGGQNWSDELFNIYGIENKDAKVSMELFLSFIHPDDLAYVTTNVENAFSDLTGSSFNFRFIKANGDTRYGYTEWRFRFNENKLPVKLYGIVKDITEQKKAEEERTKMITDIVQRNKNLEQFSYILSHNLRAPVANILGLASLLDKASLTDPLKKDIKNGLCSSVKTLDQVVRDLNQVLKVRQEVNESKQVVSFSALTDDINSSIDTMICKEQAVIVYDFSQVDEMLAIKSYLYSIFYNLISNSLKYRRPDVFPAIEIRSQRVKNQITLFFKDNGVGIDLRKQSDHVFGLYKRFHPHLAEGKGMGLYLVKTQVESIGGEIYISSEVNKGTEFRIEFKG